MPRYERDHERVGAHVGGRAFGDDAPGFEAVHAVADRQDQRQVVLDDDERGVELGLDALDQRAERLGLALGDAGGGLVEADHPGATASSAASSTMRRVPVDSSATNRSA